MLCFALGKESEVRPSQYSSDEEYWEVGMSSCPCAATV